MSTIARSSRRAEPTHHARQGSGDHAARVRLPRCGWAPTGRAPSATPGWERIPHVMSSHRFADWEAAPGWVVQRAGGQHGDEDVEQAVHDATDGASMIMPAGAQTFVVRATDRIMAGGGLAPMVRRLAQPRIARVAHADQGAAPALTSDGCHAGLRPQPVVISGRQQPRGFGEHRGGADSPDAHRGPEDRHVTMLLTLPQAFQQPLDLRGALRPLLMDQPQARQVATLGRWHRTGSPRPLPRVPVGPALGW